MDAAAMEIYDIIMLVVLLGAAVFGAVKGFAWQLASISSIVASYIVAYRFREPFSQSIQADPPWNRVCAMLILYVGTALVIWVAFRMIRRTIDRLRLKEFDRQVGALFGLAKGLLYCMLITLFAVTLFGDRTRDAVVGSKSGRYIAHALHRSGGVIPSEIHDLVGPYLEKFDRRLNQAPGTAGSSIAQDRLGVPTARELWDGGSANPPLPIEPRQWMPQQAQQPTWNSLQR
jgi:membrane protein required for colicin V production